MKIFEELENIGDTISPSILRETITSLNITQKKLAKLIGVNYTTISRWATSSNNSNNRVCSGPPAKLIRLLILDSK